MEVLKWNYGHYCASSQAWGGGAKEGVFEYPVPYGVSPKPWHQNGRKPRGRLLLVVRWLVFGNGLQAFIESVVRL